MSKQGRDQNRSERAAAIRAQHEGEDHPDQARRQRHPRAVHEAREHVAAKIVGAEEVDLLPPIVDTE